MTNRHSEASPACHVVLGPGQWSGYSLRAESAGSAQRDGLPNSKDLSIPRSHN